jgi:hypothetical protein
MTKKACHLLLCLLALSGYAQAQQTTFYGADGRVVGRETRSGNATTFFGPNGRVTSRSRTHSGGTTTYFGPDGRVVGRSTTPRR